MQYQLVARDMETLEPLWNVKRDGEPTHDEEGTLFKSLEEALNLAFALNQRQEECQNKVDYHIYAI